MKNKPENSENYILLPVSDTELDAGDSPKVADFLTRLSQAAQPVSTILLTVRQTQLKPLQPDNNIPVKVLDSIQPRGAKLVRISDEKLPDFRFSYPGLRMIPEKFYWPAVCRQQKIQRQIVETDTASPFTVQVTGAQGKPLPGITVVVFSDFAARKGASGQTDAQGQLSLKLDKPTAQRIYLYAADSYWSGYRENVPLEKPLHFELVPIDTGYRDALRFFYPAAGWPELGRKVRIGIIDTGVGPHRDLKVSGGKNLVRGEEETDYHDNGEGHGTHVGGIIAASGQVHGLAAGAEIMSYRVFPKGGGASNFDIMKALNQAITDQCDLINMSLGEAQQDEGITSYIKAAYNAGILCFAANGNDDRSPVSFPAAYSLTLAVSAMGRKGTFPPDSVEAGAVSAPFGTDPDNFIADFSNTGPETDLTAPGVGIISTFPGNKYAVMDGTSMACPAAAGMAARLLSGKPELLDLPRNQTRADEFLKYLSLHIKGMGFGSTFEGKGMLTDDNELHTQVQRK